MTALLVVRFMLLFVALMQAIVDRPQPLRAPKTAPNILVRASFSNVDGLSFGADGG